MAYMKHFGQNSLVVQSFNKLVEKDLTKSTLGQVLEYVGGCCDFQYRDKNESILDIDNDGLEVLRDEKVLVLLDYSYDDTLSLIIFFEELEEADVYNTIDDYQGELHNGAYDMLEMVRSILG